LAIKAPAKRKKAAPRAKTPEAAIQSAVEAYLRLRGLAWFHIPDALLRAGFSQGSAVNYALINAAAEVRGFPDLVIFDPERHGFVLPLELKTSVGVVNVNQRNWKRSVGTKVCRSFEEAKAEIDLWMKDPAGYWRAA
jgi:hypothetical protein